MMLVFWHTLKVVENDKKNINQLDLFGLTPEDKKEQLIKVKKRKNLEVEKQKNLAEILIIIEKERDFNEAVKQTRIYLSWGRNHKCNWIDEFLVFQNDGIEGIESSIIKEKGTRVYKFKWILPLYEECVGSILNDHFRFPSERNFQIDNECYESLLESCDNLFDPSEGYGKGDDIFAALSYDGDSYNFDINDISFVRQKNIITFQYKLPKEIDDIYINDDQIFSDAMKYAIT